MVDLRKATHGPGSMKGLNLVAIAYDRSVAKDEKGELKAQYIDMRLHPDDERAAGQKTLALVTERDEKSPSGYNNKKPYSAGQFEAITKAAGDNKTPLLDREGNAVGTIYGLKGDVFINKGALIVNTKSVEASEMSVADVDGKDIRSRIFESQAAAKAAEAEAKAAAAEAPAPEAEAQVETLQAQVEALRAEARAEAPQADEQEFGA